MIDVRHVSRFYHRGVDLVHALEDVSLAVLGPSGITISLRGRLGLT